MPNDTLSSEIDLVLKKMENNEKAQRKPQPDPEPEDGPVVTALIAKGLRLIDELDPLIREKYRDDPATLAEWDDIMRMRDDPK